MLFAGIGVVLDGPLILFFEGRTPHFRAWVTFGRSGPLTFLFHASGGPISFSSERNGGKNAAKNQWFLEFLSSDHSHAAKRPTPNRSCPYPRCRFHVPQENAVSYRRGTVYLRVVRRSGSDKRTARDSLYDDVRQFKSRVVRGGGFQRTPAAQEVLKPAVSSSVFGHFWGCGQKRPALGGAELSPSEGAIRAPPVADAGGVSEWQRSKFQASAVRKRRNFGHRNSVPFTNKEGRRGRRSLRVCGRTVQ